MKTFLRKLKWIFLFLLCFCLFFGLFVFFAQKDRFVPQIHALWEAAHPKPIKQYPYVFAERKSFQIEIKTIGEIEASRSTTVSSAIRGDLGKILYLVEDGKTVQPGEILVRLDPTPFEESVEALVEKIKEQEAKIESQAKIYEWETAKASYDLRSVETEQEVSQLELIRLKDGEGPIEMGRLKIAMQKAETKYVETKGYLEDLKALELDDLFTPTEIRQVEKKLQEEAEAYETAKMQYESYLNHVYPMLVKKGEINCKKCAEKKEETYKASQHRIELEKVKLEQGQYQLNELHNQLQNIFAQIELTMIKAHNEGMVVLREDFRNGQRRKPRVGDQILKNQIILDLPDMSSAVIKTRVKEIDLYKIHKGTPVSVEVDAYPDLILQGEIETIGVLGVVDYTKMGDQKYFEVTVKLLETDSRLRPGMTSRLTMHAHHIEDQMTIPVQALFEEERKYYCYLENLWGECHKKPVTIGWFSDQWVEILEGIHDYDKVLLVAPQDEMQ